MELEEINAMIKQLKKIAKEITLTIPTLDPQNSRGQLHSQSLDLLMGLSELENKLAQFPTINIKSQTTRTKLSSNDENQEIKKVRNRLPRWANNPNQINSKILALFLRLKLGDGPVTANDLRTAYGNSAEFDKNFVQMKMISERNHGKVFEVENGLIEIWPKVKEYVEAFAIQIGV